MVAVACLAALVAGCGRAGAPGAGPRGPASPAPGGESRSASAPGGDPGGAPSAPGSAGGDAAASGSSIAKASTRAAASRLSALVDALAVSPQVTAALDQRAAAPRSELRQAWHAGREAFRQALQSAGARALVEAGLDGAPTPSLVAACARLVLTQRLLARPFDEGDGPLFPEGEDPGLDAALAQALGARWEPAVNGRAEADPGGAEHPAYQRAWSPYRARLVEGGRRWRALRATDDFEVPEGPARGFNPRVRIQTLGGTAFEDPAQAFAEGAFGALYSARDQQRFRLAPAGLDLELAPVAGDLYLLVVAWDLTRSCHLELEVPGDEETLRLVVSRDAVVARQRLPPPPDDLPGGIALRVRAAAVPAGARRLRIRVVGAPGVGRSEATALVGEVLQLVEGPAPVVFAGHAWGEVAADPGEDEALQKAQLAESLARIERRGGSRKDPAAIFQAARAMHQAGSNPLARSLLQRADRIRPDHPATLNLLGEVCWALGDHAAARRAWQRSAAADPRGRGPGLLRRHAAPAGSGEG